MLNQYDIQGRVAVFIDAANILYSQRTLGWRIDYARLKKYFEREVKLAALYFYTGKVGEDGKQERFLAKMAQLGYLVRSKEVKRIRIAPDTYEWKGNLDAELIIDALKSVDAYDVCILMSGDSDFAPLIDELKAQGKRVFVMSTKHHIARELIERAKYVNLRKLEADISYKNDPPGREAGERSDKNHLI